MCVLCSSLIDPASGEVIFSTSDPEWRLPQGLHTLEVDQAEVRTAGGCVADPDSMDLHHSWIRIRIQILS